MTASLSVAGILLVVAPLLGAVPVAHPALMPIWSASREDYLRAVRAHVMAWRLLNAGFAMATIGTTAGLAILSASDDRPAPHGALLLAIVVAYAMGGVLWLAVLAIRAARDPMLADLTADERPTEPAESLLGAATSGLFDGFVFITSIALVALAVVLASGGVAVPIAGLAGLIAAGVLAVQLQTGDCIPAILYLPTMLVGVAVLAGWT